MMRIIGNRTTRRTDAKQELSGLLAKPNTVLLIHYSCESFSDCVHASSPRITSIAIRLPSGLTKSFSIHQVAERETDNGKIDEDKYDQFERQMLKEFYDFVHSRDGYTWLHWNMRDIKYGFTAIAHRFRTLGGTPVEIHESKRVDLARLLVSRYGRRYVSHPRLQRIIELNQMTMTDFLTGRQEADAFKNGNYVAMHRSTLRKVDNLSGILERLADGTLKTNAGLIDIYGNYLAAFKEFVTTHWLVSTLGLGASVATLFLFVRVILF